MKKGMAAARCLDMKTKIFPSRGLPDLAAALHNAEAPCRRRCCRKVHLAGRIVIDRIWPRDRLRTQAAAEYRYFLTKAFNYDRLQRHAV